MDSHLKSQVRIAGVDLSPAMLRLARRRNPEVPYMRTPRDRTRAFVTAYRHLRAGGAFFTYAEYVRGSIEQNHTEVIRGRRSGDEVVFVENLYDPNPEDTTFEATFVCNPQVRSTARGTDHHVLGCLPAATWRDALRHAGFEVRHAGRDRSVPGVPATWFAARGPTYAPGTIMASATR